MLETQKTELHYIRWSLRTGLKTKENLITLMLNNGCHCSWRLSFTRVSNQKALTGKCGGLDIKSGHLWEVSLMRHGHTWRFNCYIEIKL